eukprot:PITA_03610
MPSSRVGFQDSRRKFHHKVNNLPTLRSSQEANTRELKERDDKSMLDVEEPMDLIDPPPHEPSSSRKRPSWLRGILDDAEGHVAPQGTFRQRSSSQTPGQTVVTSKWIYKIKHAVDGSTENHFVARGFYQKEGIDYDVIFALVARYMTICSIIAFSASQGWNLHQMDVKTVFLHGSIKEKVYVEQPQGFEIYDRKSHVCRLKKALYGL